MRRTAKWAARALPLGTRFKWGDIFKEVYNENTRRTLVQPIEDMEIAGTGKNGEGPFFTDLLDVIYETKRNAEDAWTVTPTEMELLTDKLSLCVRIARGKNRSIEDVLNQLALLEEHIMTDLKDFYEDPNSMKRGRWDRVTLNVLVDHIHMIERNMQPIARA